MFFTVGACVALLKNKVQHFFMHIGFAEHCGELEFMDRPSTMRVPFPVSAFCCATEDIVVINDQVSQASTYPAQTVAAYKDSLMWAGSLHQYNISTNLYEQRSGGLFSSEILDGCSVVDGDKERIFFIGGRTSWSDTIQRVTQV